MINIIPPFTPNNKPLFAFIVDAPSFDDGRNHLSQQQKGKVGWPLYGAAGRRFTQLASNVNISRWENYVGYVFPEIRTNKLENICVGKDQQWEDINYISGGGQPPFPIPPLHLSNLLYLVKHPIAIGKYIPQSHWHYIIKLWHQLNNLEWEQNGIKLPILVPMGNVALWAICGKLGIDKARGAQTDSLILRTDNTPFNVFPTFHPQFTLYAEKQRALLAADLRKLTEVLDEKKYLTQINIWIPQTPDELETLINKYIGTYIGADIETPRKQRSKLIDIYEDDNDNDVIDVGKWPPIATRQDRFIKMIGFNSDGKNSIVIPFYHPYMSNGCWWKTADDHLKIMQWVNAILTHKDIYKIFQNGSFDVQYIKEIWQISITNYVHDTRLMHHALQPAMPKDLATLASIYLNLPAWKFAPQTGKRDE